MAGRHVAARRRRVASVAYGILVVAGAWLAGPMQPAVRIRRVLAPYLASPWATYGAVAVVVLLVLLWGPTEGTRRVLPALVLLALLVGGVEALRRQVRAEPVEARREAPHEGQGDTALIAQLERLDALHRDGGLGDEEFAAAKHRVLEHA